MNNTIEVEISKIDRTIIMAVFLNYQSIQVISIKIDMK